MKAAVYHKPTDLAVEERDVYDIRDDEVLLKTRAASICGTDLRIFKGGHFKIPSGSSRVLGHEVSGEIARVGKMVRGFREGMRVSFTPNIGCGHCEMCRQGFNNMCADYEAFGVSIDGGFQEYMVVPDIAIRGGNMFEIADNLTYEEAAVVEPLSCCYNAFSKLHVTPEDTVLIIGPGPIGACFVQFAKIAGARKIIVAGRRDERLREMERFGAHVTVNTSRKDLKAKTEAITKGRGVDVVITAASAPELQPLSVELLATHGRVNFFGGLPKGTLAAIDTNRVHYRGLTLTGTTGSSNEDYYRSMQLVANGQINVRDIVSNTFPIDDIGAAFALSQAGASMKSMIVYN